VRRSEECELGREVEDNRKSGALGKGERNDGRHIGMSFLWFVSSELSFRFVLASSFSLFVLLKTVSVWPASVEQVEEARNCKEARKQHRETETNASPNAPNWRLCALSVLAACRLAASLQVSGSQSVSGGVSFHPLGSQPKAQSPKLQAPSSDALLL